MLAIFTTGMTRSINLAAFGKHSTASYQPFNNDINGRSFFGQTPFMEMYIVMTNYKKAIDWYNALLDEKFGKIVEPTQFMAHAMAIVGYYEMGSDEVVSSLCRSVSRKLSENKLPHKMEQTLARFIENVPAEMERRTHFLQFKNELAKLKSDPVEAAKFSFLDFEVWAESKLLGISLEELVRKHQSETAKRRHV